MTNEEALAVLDAVMNNILRPNGGSYVDQMEEARAHFAALSEQQSDGMEFIGFQFATAQGGWGPVAYGSDQSPPRIAPPHRFRKVYADPYAQESQP